MNPGSLAKQGSKNPMFGRTHSDETRKKMRENGKNHFLRGEKHPGWKGGITNERKLRMGRYSYKMWRKAVKDRDGWKCVECDSTENLHVDHIKPYCQYPELELELDNGRTLCFQCHKKTESYGKRY